MITENGEILSARQFWKRVKAVLKADPVMSGSGHLYLHHTLPQPLPDQTVISVQSHAIEALRAQGLDGFDEEQVRERIAIILRTIARPGRGKPPKPQPMQQRDPKHRDPKQRKQKQQKPERVAHHRPAPVIQVTIKKARAFHYPRDLPTGDKS